MSRAETHRTLYHFTSVELWPHIRAAGILNLSPPLDMQEAGKPAETRPYYPRRAAEPGARVRVHPACVWLTASDDRERQERWARLGPTDKSAVRIAVRVPLFTVARVADAALQNGMPRPVYDLLKGYGPRGEFDRWWWCKRAIPMAEWLRVDYVSEGLRLYTAGR